MKEKKIITVEKLISLDINDVLIELGVDVNNGLNTEEVEKGSSYTAKIRLILIK